MEEVQKVGFGHADDTNEQLQSKSGGKFGLNQGFLTKFEFNPTAGKDGTAGNAIDITVQIGDKKFMARHYEVSKVFGKDGEITDTNSLDYKTGYNKAMVQLTATITHIVKAFASEDAIKTALATPPTNFADWAKIMCALVPSTAKTTPIDVFLEYQWEIADGQNRTFLQLPKNMKGGYFICSLTEGNWVENKDGGSLCYTNGTEGIKHKFERSSNYISSKKAIQQIEGEADVSIDNGNPQSSTW